MFLSVGIWPTKHNCVSICGESEISFGMISPPSSLSSSDKCLYWASMVERPATKSRFKKEKTLVKGSVEGKQKEDKNCERSKKWTLSKETRNNVYLAYFIMLTSLICYFIYFLIKIFLYSPFLNFFIWCYFSLPINYFFLLFFIRL